MTDKELLMLAAKAIGGTVWTDIEGHVYTELNGSEVDWNPLTDDGDALRLAVKLGIDLKFTPGATWVKLHEELNRLDLDIVRHDDDPCGATRRAIVRAAAAIGEATK